MGAACSAVQLGGYGLPNAAREHKQHDEHGRARGVCAPLTARHGSRIEPRRRPAASTASGLPPARWYIAFRPYQRAWLAILVGPRSSGDRAPPSGGGSASSNLAGGAIRNTLLTRGNAHGARGRAKGSCGARPHRGRKNPKSGSFQGPEPGLEEQISRVACAHGYDDNDRRYR